MHPFQDASSPSFTSFQIGCKEYELSYFRSFFVKGCDALNDFFIEVGLMDQKFQAIDVAKNVEQHRNAAPCGLDVIPWFKFMLDRIGECQPFIASDSGVVIWMQKVIKCFLVVQ